MIYLDCNSTTPIDPRVAEIVQKYLIEEFGNAGSRTHEYGNNAKVAVQKAREQIASVVQCKREEVIWTSGATESNNIALQGLIEYGNKNNKRHIISTTIEHKSILEPLKYLEKKGFEISLISPDETGKIKSCDILNELREDTLLISMMHINNETGVKQPIAQVAKDLLNSQVFFHIDAAQGFGKDIEALQNQRIDMISISGHKLYSPKGIGALIARRRGFDKVPLTPIVYGGGQERGLRSGTLPVHLIVGFGLSAQLALKENDKRDEYCQKIKDAALKAFSELDYKINGILNDTISSTLNISFSGLDSEAVMLSLKDLLAVSNGSACTSQNYAPSHVLKAMGFSDEECQESLRFSWSYLTEKPNWEAVALRIKDLFYS